jgi:hypothetical protein
MIGLDTRVKLAVGCHCQRYIEKNKLVGLYAAHQHTYLWGFPKLRTAIEVCHLYP